ncbi:MAG: NAD(P)-dependent oxidoreductase [Magnetococcales bacterium]|nr:NAD(P)-dependent oxidoreductase [Magnetococcales bacterium]
MRVGMLGLGAMGSGMAGNLARAGLLRSIWNRTPDKARLLSAELGAEVAQSPQQLMAQCDLVVVSVKADADLLQVAAALSEGISPGKVVVDTSTVAPRTAIAVSGQLTQRGGAFLDAPVSGGPEGARRGNLSMFVGGEASVLERVRPALQTLAGRILPMGEVGSGQAAKAVNQVMVAGINQAVTEALAFGSVLGLPMTTLLPGLAGGAAGNWFLDHRGANMLAGEFPAGFKVALHHKDLRICLELAEARGLNLPLVAETARQYEILLRQEHGEEDISALYRLKRP